MGSTGTLDDDDEDAKTPAAPASTTGTKCLFRIGTNTIMLLKGAAAGGKFQQMTDRLKGIYREAAKDVATNDDLNKFYQRLRSLTVDQISWMEMVLYPDTVNNAATARQLYESMYKCSVGKWMRAYNYKTRQYKATGRGRGTATQTGKCGLHGLGWHRPSVKRIQTFAVRLHCSLRCACARVL